jgi:hypothetical protein
MEPADQTELLAQLQALQDAAAAAAAAVAAADEVPPPLVPRPPPVFTLAPALANTANYIDLTSTSGTKHFKGAAEPLNAHPFNFADASDLQVFLDLVLKKSQVWGWNTIFTIPVTNATGAEPVTANNNLLSEYGMIPLDSARAQVMSYSITQP